MDLALIKGKIHTIRGKQVMLDSDLAELYGVKGFRLKESVKRNSKRFPKEFMFQLTTDEINSMVSQNAIPSKQQFGGSLPYVFTEQGVAMISGVLRSETAIRISIQIMQAFVAMRHFLLENKSLFSRVSLLERNQLVQDDKINELFNVLASYDTIPSQGIFYDGQIWDAYVLVNKILKTAKKNIALFDNYLNEDVLTLFSKYSVPVTIYTKNVTKQLELDVKKYNEQYGFLEVVKFDRSHDRFLLIDEKKVYHIGASLKDLGKKIFAFSKIEKNNLKLITEK